MGRLTPTSLVFTLAAGLTLSLSACDTVEQVFGKGAQVLTVSPSGGAAYEGRCVPRGAEPVEITGTATRTFEFEDGVACRILQKGEGALTVELNGPRGTSTVTTDSDGEMAAVSRG